jgi:hypothetical protein
MSTSAGENLKQIMLTHDTGIKETVASTIELQTPNASL